MRPLLILLMVGLPVFAQVMLPARRIVPSAPASASQPFPDPFYWWVSDDESTNYVQLSSWTDRVQSFQFTQTTNSYQPFNTPEGVYLTVDRHMNNTALASLTNYTFAFILNPRARLTSFGQIWGWLPGTGRGFGLGATTNFILDLNGTIQVLSSTLIITNLYDLTLTAQSYSGGSGATNMVLSAYVNGVLFTNYYLSPSVAVLPMDRIGDDDPFNDAGTEFVREIIVWTNELSAADVLLVHQYRTNTYPSLYASYPSLNTGLTAHWNLDEASGTRVDCIGGNDVFETNTVTSAAGKLSDAAVFLPANSEYLFLDSVADLQMGDIDFTWSAWVYRGAIGARDIIAKWATGSLEYRIEYDNVADRMKFHVTGDGSTITTVQADGFGSPPSSTWFHVRAWHDATANQIGISCNNGTTNTAAHTTGVFVGTATFGIASRSPTAGTFWSGNIDEVSLWKRLLSVDEAWAVYNFGWARFGCPSY